MTASPQNGHGPAMDRLARLGRVVFPTRAQRAYIRRIKASGRFDTDFYRAAYSGIHPAYLKMPVRHYVTYGEAHDYRPNPDFSPSAYLKYSPDVEAAGCAPFSHFLDIGHSEGRLTKDLPKVSELPAPPKRSLRADPGAKRSRLAIVAHVYYHDLWPEFAHRLTELRIDYDLYVTVTYKGDDSDRLIADIGKDFPSATVVPVANKGRDILPFLTLVNAGLLDGYDAVCKIHTKKSPHRDDGDPWRRHLIDGVLPPLGLEPRLDAFLTTSDAAIWVADGQWYSGEKWWGSNLETTRHLLNRIERGLDPSQLQFPAGSIYWLKPTILSQLKSLHLTDADFEIEEAQVDGTLAHAIERVLGYLATAAGQRVYETAAIVTPAPDQRTRPSFVSAFYLPQFHPTPENDAWWGKGFTEWRGVTTAKPVFEGHTQPMLPADLGYYDLRVTDVMGQQSSLARDAGIDAFCVYHYWFDGKRVLDKPLGLLLDQPDVDFPFYLCWANESWRRNWDGLSGEVLLEQGYQPGFEAKLARDVARYMADPRYSRPDGIRPRFMIYRPGDMPDPAASVAKLRDAWLNLGIGDVELGAVAFHVNDRSEVPDDLFDFWVEMPPHGMVGADAYLFGGPSGNLIGPSVSPGFEGLVYSYDRVIDASLDPARWAKLPSNTICGAMPSWDNSARRGLTAHIAHGATPARFRHWIDRLCRERVDASYRQEMFLNAWNEWAEKATLEPSITFGRGYLDAVKEIIAPMHRSEAPCDARRQRKA